MGCFKFASSHAGERASKESCVYTASGIKGGILGIDVKQTHKKTLGVDQLYIARSWHKYCSVHFLVSRVTKMTEIARESFQPFLRFHSQTLRTPHSLTHNVNFPLVGNVEIVAIH